MADYIEIAGPVRLNGEITASGAKNAVLPMLMATLLTADTCTLSGVPNLRDVSLTFDLLETFGCEASLSRGVATVSTPTLLASEASYSLVKSLRASFWVLSPLLARGGAARVALPGGDIIGARPIDIHLEALTKMGAEIKVRHGVVYATAPHGLKPAMIEFRFPSVGATHQLLMAASLTPGTTIIRGAAREPEVVALAEMLQLMGADIEGAGSTEIIVRGKDELSGANVQVIGDRIEAGTYLIAAAATGGRVRVNGISPLFLEKLLLILEDIGCEVVRGANFIELSRSGPLKACKVSTGPFPELATDLQAPLMAALCCAEGTSEIEEKIFEGRFGNIAELCRMGARIIVNDRSAIITGVAKLSGAPVEGLDIRAAASLVIAALAAEGVTQISEIHHLRRGYDQIESKLIQLGASLTCRTPNPEDHVFTGC